MATPEIAVKSLDLLNKSEDFEIQAVVTQTDKPAGRGKKIQFSPIKKYAIDNDIKIFQPSSIRKDLEIQRELKSLEPDYFVTFAFGQILSQEVLDIPKIATINLHASLLPKYRGANPIQRALINGDSETGICTMITDIGLDSGDVCLSKKIPLTEDTNFEQLHDTISELAPDLIKQTLIGLKDKTITPQKQDENFVTIAKKLQSDEEKINTKNSAIEIHNLVRGIYKSPCAYLTFNDKKIKILQTSIVDRESIYEKTGEVIKINKEGIELTTGKGTIRLITIKPEGKGEMLASAWVNGAKVKIGDIFL
jgi:methionyl-tRNA formyltransferase